MLLILLQDTGAVVALWRDEPSNLRVVCLIVLCKSIGGGYTRWGIAGNALFLQLWWLFPALCRRKAVLKYPSDFTHLWGSFSLKSEWYPLGCWLESVTMEIHTAACKCKPQIINPGFSKEFFLSSLFFSLNTCVHQGSWGGFSEPHLH